MAEASVVTDGERALIRGTIGFDNAGALLDDLAQLIAAQPSVTIDLSQVEHGNSAGLALLVECQALGERHAHPVRIESLPAGLAQLAGVCQLDTVLEPARG